ncbi:hypothetical protein ACKGJN_07440 [Gillisia sp. Q332]|uniref:hypothetical protein n=1 Tax=Gillisia xinjiangensis TaxID=3384765 RepID=UPI00391B52C9
MDLLILRLLFDFGLVVLIWIVQLVIYPGLCYYSQTDLVKWHKLYTTRIAYVVGPLMIGQFLIAAFQLWKEVSLYTISGILIIAALWILTFSIFVPLHNAVMPGKNCETITSELVKKNWIRTGLWSLVFLLSLLQYVWS